MSKLTILKDGAAVLRRPTIQVVEVDDKIRKIAKELRRAQVLNRGLGVAANQIGYSLAMFVWRKGEIVLNPHLEFLGEKVLGDEGCLSIPGRTYPVMRSREVKLSGLSLDGEEFVSIHSDLEARILQHECDHLVGKLIKDYV
jgi:peptide deformylase